MGALYILYMEGAKTKMTTESLEVIAQLKADYFKKEAEKVDALNKKKMDNTSEMREGLLYALRRHPVLSVLEPFAKWDQRTDEDGIIPMACSIEILVPEHAPIYVFMERDYRHDESKPIVWTLGNRQHPVCEITAWTRGHHGVSFYRHSSWDLGEVLAFAESQYVDYFHVLENGDNSQAIQTQQPEMYISPAEKALVRALRDFIEENRPEE